MNWVTGVRRLRDAEWLRFLIAGGVNTATTLVLYWMLLPVTGYVVAYSGTIAAGIALSYLLSSRFVFRAVVSPLRAGLFPLVYGVQFLSGLLVLWIWVDVWGLPPNYGIIATIGVTIPITFVLSRLVLTGRVS
jgi:putative flippase GtrA